MRGGILLAGVVLFLATPGIAHCDDRIGANRRTAFTNVNVVPMDRDIVLPHHTVVVEDGKITVVAPSESAAIPSDASIIDGDNRYLMPGLADMHTHTLDAEEFTLLLANGVTTVRNMFGDTLHLRWKKQINEGTLLAPFIYTAGPIIDGNPPMWPESDVVENAKQAEEVVARQSQLPYDFLKIYWLLTPEAFDAIMAAAKKHHKTVVGHVPFAVDLEHALASGMKSIEHLTGYEYCLVDTTIAPEGLSIWARLDTNRLEYIAKQTADAGVWSCPTLVIWQNRVAVGEDSLLAAMLARPESRYLSAESKEYWLPQNNYLADFPPGSIANGRATDPVRKHIVRALHQAGAGILLGTDYGNPFVVPGFSLLDELDNLVDAGLTPYEAIRAGTSAAAEFMAAGDDFGSVKVGCRADLILLEANPLDDVTNVRKRAGVMLRGRWFTESDLERMLEELAARHETE